MGSCPAGVLGPLPLGGQEWACLGGMEAAQTVPPFCILLLLNHRLYKIDGFLHLCQCGDCLKGRIGPGQALTPPPRPPARASTHTHTHTHTIFCILFARSLQPGKQTV